MPISIMKGSLKYCTENKLFFLFILILFLILEYLTDIIDTPTAYGGTIIFWIISIGYGLQITEDVINGGARLPKIMPKKLISFGIKGTIITLFYTLIQGIPLSIVASFLNFPTFEIEDFFLEYNKTLLLIFNHDIGSFVIFVISGIIITYVTVFFMELSLARLADGGKLRNSFNFGRIKHAIDIIGWKRYTIGYTKIILVVVLFSYINKFFDPYYIINIIVGLVCLLISFIVEYRGIGIVYKVYVDTKKGIANED